jgi:hypothetical protein
VILAHLYCSAQNSLDGLDVMAARGHFLIIKSFDRDSVIRKVTHRRQELMAGEKTYGDGDDPRITSVQWLGSSKHNSSQAML